MAAATYRISTGADGVVRIEQHGFWDAALADQFVAEAGTAVNAARLRGALRLIIDARHFQVPGSEVSERLSAFDRRVRRDADRVAMVVASSLLKMQMKRQIDRPGLELVLTPDEAEAWVAG